jgi:hypothetical protein
MRLPDRTGELDERTDVITDLTLDDDARRAGRERVSVGTRGAAVSGRRPVLGGLLLVLGLVLLGAAGYGGYQVVAHRDGSPSAANGASGSAPSATPASPASSASSPAPTPSPAGLVAVAPALQARPETAEVRGLLERYFTAINQRDYAAYRDTLVLGPRVKSEDQFRTDFQSTRDSDVRLFNLRDDPGGRLVASVSFVSHQAPADAPDGVSDCLQWTVSYPLVRVDGQFRIDVVPNREPDSRPC